MIILPSRFQTFLTNRSRSRSILGQNRGHTPCMKRQQKTRSIFAVPPVSKYEQESFGVTTDISTSSWAKSQKDIESGHYTNEEQKSSIWNPLRTVFPKRARSLQTSFWSAVDRSGSPQFREEPTRRPNVTGFQAMTSRTESAEASGKPSVDEQVELLQVPRDSYQPSSRHESVYDDITALPKMNSSPDHGIPYFSSSQR